MTGFVDYLRMTLGWLSVVKQLDTTYSTICFKNETLTKSQFSLNDINKSAFATDSLQLTSFTNESLINCSG